MSAGPFLFAAGYVLDYQFVVCPFVDKARISAFRRLISPLVLQPTKSPQLVRLEDPLLGSVAFVYSSQPAQVKGEAAYDNSHRPVQMVSGVVFDRSEAQNPDLGGCAPKILEKALPSLATEFEGFWDKRTPTQGPIRGPSIGPIPPRPYARVAVALSLALVASIGVNAVLIHRNHDKVGNELAKKVAILCASHPESGQFSPPLPEPAPWICPYLRAEPD